MTSRKKLRKVAEDKLSVSYRCRSRESKEKTEDGLDVVLITLGLGIEGGRGKGERRRREGEGREENEGGNHSKVTQRVNSALTPRCSSRFLTNMMTTEYCLRVGSHTDTSGSVWTISFSRYTATGSGWMKCRTNELVFRESVYSRYNRQTLFLPSSLR